MADPFVFYQNAPAMYTGWLPVATENLFYACSGFEIRTLPALTPGQNQKSADLIAGVLYRFQRYLLELHDSGVRRAVALQIMSHPDQAVMDSRVRIYILCRSAHSDQNAASQDVRAFVKRAADGFPKGEGFYYGQPVWLSGEQLQTALFTASDGRAWPEIDIVELRKFEDRQTWSQYRELHYVPHRYWADTRRDAWLGLIETLATTPTHAAIRVEVNPVRLDPETGLDVVAGAGRWFGAIGEDLDRRQSQGDKQERPDLFKTSEAARSGEVEKAASNASFIGYVQRGRHVYQKLVANRDRLFGMRVVLAARGKVPEALIGATRAALSAPASEDAIGALGWMRPDVVRPLQGDFLSALNNLTFLIQRRWATTPPNPAIGNFADLRYIVTPEEAASLFHLPVYDQPGQTSAVSTSDTPFVIPPEALAADRFKKGERKIRIGYLFQREEYLAGDDQGNGGQPFCVTTGDLMKPSLLVGKPGSGKSNLAFSLLIQFWEKKMPFLVLDPSTGNEYRRLFAHEKLKDDLIVYTVGDTKGLTLQFNPFSVPPGITIRNHTTRLLAAFQAAMPMHDPVPAIYDAALERLYTDERYCGAGRATDMDAEGTPDLAAPTFSDFARAIQDELNENALRLYKGSAEAIGIIRGASTVRVDAIGRKLGKLLNTPANNTEFFQNLLLRPAVIEMGALGDTANIALLMAFMLSQLSGHIEYQFRQMEAGGKKREHVILIEEAHRLLAAGEKGGAAGKSAEDLNVMLAEIRKFGQGIMILDQRPSSLVGGVLDNAQIRILMSLSDSTGFERLSDELNLSEAQRRFAHRLKIGQAIVLDREAGLPVLTAEKEIKIKRFAKDEELRQMRANAQRWGLTPPQAVPYVSPPNPETEAAKPAAAVAAVKKEAKIETAREWLSAEIERSVLEVLKKLPQDSYVFYAAKDLLELKRPDVNGAKQAVQEALSKHPALLDGFLRQILEQTQWAAVSMIAEKHFPELAAPIAEMRQSAATGAQSPLLETDSVFRWVNDYLAKLTNRLGEIVTACENDPALKEPVLASLQQQPPDLDKAKQIIGSTVQPLHSRMEAYFSRLLDDFPWAIVGAIAGDSSDVAAQIRQKFEPKSNQKRQATQA